MSVSWIDSFSDALAAALPKGLTRGALPALPGAAAALAGVTLAKRSPVRCAWVVVDGKTALDRVYADLCAIGKSAGITPSAFPQAIEEDADTAGARAQVIRLMRTLADDSGSLPLPNVIVAPVAAMLQPVPDPDALRQASVTLRAGASYAFDELVTRLSETGYARMTEVQEPGQMAVRGGVLDIWPATAKTPWRAEFFGSELESLRMFDPATQRSIEPGESVWIPPCSETAALRTLTVAEVVPKGIGVLWLDHEGLRFAAETEAAWESLTGAFTAKQPWLELFSGDPAPPRIPTVDFPITVVPGLAELGADVARHPELLTQARRSLLNTFIEQGKAGTSIFLCADTAGTCELLLREVDGCAGIAVRKMALSGGFALPGCVVAAQPDLYAVSKRNLRRTTSFMATPNVGQRIEQAADLEPGDYVVHVDYGIGRFLGSTEIEVDGVRSEVFTIEYAGGARLHVSVTNAHLLSRYVGVAGHPVKLHTLSGKRWTKEKADAERAVQDLAGTLLETQARRQVMTGIAFDPDPMCMREFEADFPYQETVDQERVIQAIKEDMALPRPMDRLVCGDAGYGKTEVAMRAAFIAVMNGKQVAVLVPTTVLSEQHYETFCDRMAPYPVRIAVANRLHSASSRERAFREAAEGKVDILIGTHALLSDRLAFKELGLLIIDEEQRFGVAHKEKLKCLRQVVDVLTLTATPIPRTLYMSMTGARDMSLLQTPPRERVPVDTRVVRDTDSVLRQAILQEVQRGGQVYFLYNRVMTIEIMRARLERLMPEIRIAVAHGQMPPESLSKIMSAFGSGEIDVLLCTTIVESGLDIPRANTMIVHRADRFGIAELYQLRGRVGRSSVKGFCWLLLPENGLVDAEARERIAALRKHSGLGAGFNLALRDLEIRGSGNLLGAAQSGHIAAVGFGLYCQLLKRTIARMKGEKPPLLVDVELDLDFLEFSPGMIDPVRSACLPYGYMEDEGHRMLFHRRLAEVTSPKEMNDFVRELTDRYGRPPEAVRRLIKMATLRILAAERRIGRIETRDNRILLYGRRTRFPVEISGHLPVLTGKTADQRLACIEKVLKAINVPS